jgi:hypothetical protein
MDNEIIFADIDYTFFISRYCKKNNKFLKFYLFNYLLVELKFMIEVDDDGYDGYDGVLINFIAPIF